jgi:hypothetical protein
MLKATPRTTVPIGWPSRSGRWTRPNSGPGEHDHPYVRVLAADPASRSDPLVAPPRRHSDVGQHDVRTVFLDRRQEPVHAIGYGDDVHTRQLTQQRGRALANQVVVVSHHHP